MPVADTLVTKCTLDPKDYESGARRVKTSTQSMGSVIDRFTGGGGLGGIGGQIGQIGGALKTAALTMVAFATAAGYAGYKAMQSAAAFDTLERTFSGALGSAEAGEQMMRALESYGLKSAFDLTALSRAAATLASGGLSIKTYLPVIERFALVISGVDPEGLQQVAGALLRAKGGTFGEAMEQFRRAGISSQDPAFQGRFNKGGEYVGNPDDFLKAIVSISEGRLKSIADAISGGAETDLSNAGEAIAGTFRAIGEELNVRYLPLIRDASDELMRLRDAGVIKAIGDGFLSIVDSITGQGGVTGAIKEFAVLLMAMPTIVDNLFGKDSLVGWFKQAGKWIDEHSATGIIKQWMFGTSDAGDVLGDVWGTNEARERIESMLNASKGKPKDVEIPEYAAPPLEPYTQQIASNTQELVDIEKRKLQQYALGGGEMGRFGVTPIEMSDVRTGGADKRAAQLAAIVRAEAMDLLRAMRPSSSPSMS